MSRDEYREFLREVEYMTQMNTDYAEDFRLWTEEFWAQYREEI